MEAQRLRAQSASQFGMDYNNVIRVEGENKNLKVILNQNL